MQWCVSSTASHQGSNGLKGHVNEGNLMPLGWARSCTADSYRSSGQVDLDQGLEMVRYEQMKEPIKNLSLRRSKQLVAKP